MVSLDARTLSNVSLATASHNGSNDSMCSERMNSCPCNSQFFCSEMHNSDFGGGSNFILWSSAHWEPEWISHRLLSLKCTIERLLWSFGWWNSPDPGRKHLHQGYSKDHSLDGETGWPRGDGLGPVSLEEQASEHVSNQRFPWNEP